MVRDAEGIYCSVSIFVILPGTLAQVYGSGLTVIREAFVFFHVVSGL